MIPAETFPLGHVLHDLIVYDFNEEFLRRWGGFKGPQGSCAGWACDLSSVASFPLSDKTGWLGHQTGEKGIESLRGGLQWLGRFRLALGGGTTPARAVLLSGAFNPPGSWPRQLDVPVETTATAVVFSLGATFAGPARPAIARTSVIYDDGTSCALYWHLGENVFALEDRQVTPESPRVWESKSPSGVPYAIHACVWRNPYPQRRIRKIEFRSLESLSSLIVFGVSGIQER